jgi:hypothetical protein
MEEQRMTKLGAFDELTPGKKHAFDSTDIAKKLAAEEAKVKDKKDKDKE